MQVHEMYLLTEHSPILYIYIYIYFKNFFFGGAFLWVLCVWLGSGEVLVLLSKN